MALIFNDFWTDILAIAITITVGLITFVKYSYNYWKKRNIPFITPKFPFGTLNNPIWEPISFFELSKKQYDEAKSKGYKHVGLYAFTSPMYMPIHPENIKSIVLSDFQHFVDRGIYHNEKYDPLSAHLFSIEGNKWKNLRTKLTPTFTSGKMKMMFETLVRCGTILKEAMDEKCNMTEPVDIKDMSARFTTDIIGSCAFGMDCNTFKDPNSDFRKYGKRVFEATKFEAFKGIIAFGAPTFAEFLRISITPKESSDFFLKVIRETVDYRENNNVERKDFMQLLLDLKNNNLNGKGLTFEEMAAQAYVFFLAGYETSSTTMAFCLFELATNPEIQQKVRDEVNTVLEANGGQITYDVVMNLKYMEQVIHETLRKYPPLSVLNRKCVKDYKIPGTDATLTKGTPVMISISGLQRDPEYYPDPDKFDPERFNPENKQKINPFTYMPFGEGPRVCIGLRFGMMQAKVGLSVLLKNFKFSLNNKTSLPLKMDPFNFISSILGDLWLDVERI